MLLIRVGRFISGFLSVKISDKTLLGLGLGLTIAGSFLLGLGLPYEMYYVALALIGLGCAPIFPSMIHLTTGRFGRKNSQRIMGVQMAAAYAGDVIISPFIGVVAEKTGVISIPWFLLALCIVLLVLSELVDVLVAKKTAIGR